MRETSDFWLLASNFDLGLFLNPSPFLVIGMEIISIGIKNFRIVMKIFRSGAFESLMDRILFDRAEKHLKSAKKITKAPKKI